MQHAIVPSANASKIPPAMRMNLTASAGIITGRPFLGRPLAEAEVDVSALVLEVDIIARGS